MSSAESGAGTVLAAGLALAMLLLMALLLGLGQAGVAAARAAKAADLAALAAADVHRGLIPGDPCALAGDLSVQVRVSVKTPFPWPASGVARAGPPSEAVLPGGP